MCLGGSVWKCQWKFPESVNESFLKCKWKFLKVSMKVSESVNESFFRCQWKFPKVSMKVLVQNAFNIIGFNTQCLIWLKQVVQQVTCYYVLKQLYILFKIIKCENGKIYP